MLMRELKGYGAGAAFAFIMHGAAAAALIGWGGREAARTLNISIPIMVELGLESEAQTEQSEVAPGERQREAARPQMQERRVETPQAPIDSHGELAAPQPVQQASFAPPSQAAPAPDTTAPQTMQNRAAHPPRSATYEQILLAHLERNKRYPRAARSHRQQGVAYVNFRMDREGHVLSARLARSSGHDLLDEEVLALVERAQPLPTPHTVQGSVIDLTVPVEFYLR